jgi:protein gp37
MRNRKTNIAIGWEMEVPFFFKQWGGVRKKAAGRELFGKTYDEMPRARLRQNAVPLPVETDSIFE